MLLVDYSLEFYLDYVGYPLCGPEIGVYNDSNWEMSVYVRRTEKKP